MTEMILRGRDGSSGGKGRHIRSVTQMELAAESGEQTSAASDAQHWPEDYLTMNGGVAESAKIKKAAHAAGHTERAVRTARTRSRSKSLNTVICAFRMGTEATARRIL